MPIFDIESEKAQDLRDKAERIYYTSLNHIESQTIRDMVEWAFGNGKLDEIAENIFHDEFYVGSLLNALVREYLWVQAMKDAENED
jgi:hypothetical protein